VRALADSFLSTSVEGTHFSDDDQVWEITNGGCKVVDGEKECRSELTEDTIFDVDNGESMSKPYIVM